MMWVFAVFLAVVVFIQFAQLVFAPFFSSPAWSFFTSFPSTRDLSPPVRWLRCWGKWKRRASKSKVKGGLKMIRTIRRWIIHPGEPNKKWLKPCRDACQFPFETDLRCWKTRKNLEDARYKKRCQKSIWESTKPFRGHILPRRVQLKFGGAKAEISWSALFTLITFSIVTCHLTPKDSISISNILQWKIPHGMKWFSWEFSWNFPISRTSKGRSPHLSEFFRDVLKTILFDIIGWFDDGMWHDMYTLEISILNLQITLPFWKGTSYTNLRFWVPNVNFQGCIKILMTMVNWPTI